MNAMPTRTQTPLRDKLLAVVEGLIEDAMWSPADWCADCAAMAEDRCDDCAGKQARVDELGPIAWKLCACKTDDEAKVIAALVPEVAGLLAGTERAA